MSLVCSRASKASVTGAQWTKERAARDEASKAAGPARVNPVSPHKGLIDLRGETSWRALGGEVTCVFKASLWLLC